MTRSGNGQPKLGSVAMGRYLLQAIGNGAVTPALASAYFENLQLLLKQREKLSSPGIVMLGLGPGRNGSTTLTAIVANIQGACATHENPPRLDWRPAPEQIEFHLHRFALLRDYYTVVFDASHWWLNALDAVLAAFPGAKAIGLARETEACVESFLKIKGSGRGSLNHWAPPGSGIWTPNYWDASYPVYPPEPPGSAKPEESKRRAIRRYVGEYHAALREWAEAAQDKFLLVHTEQLSSTEEQNRIFRFIGFPGRSNEAKLNAGSIADGNKAEFRF